MSKVRILILFGGQSAEHEISVISARSVYRALDRERYLPILVGISRDGRWFFDGKGNRLLENREVADGRGDQVCLGRTPGSVMDYKGKEIAEGRFDVAFPLLHGPFGEDGSIQGLLELAGVAYVGAGVAASAVGMDKELARSLFESAGLKQTKYVVIRRSRWRDMPESVADMLESELAYPMFVKPVNLGSSIGVSIVYNRSQLAKGLDHSSCYDTKIMIEAAVEDARELECAVLGADNPQVSGVGEIEPRAEFYDYRTKYIDDCAKLIIPADLPNRIVEEIQEITLKAFRAIDCNGLARVDFLVSQDGSVWLNEINTMPGFTPISMYPKLWEAAGIGYKELIHKLVELALDRFADRRDLVTGLLTEHGVDIDKSLNG